MDKDWEITRFEAMSECTHLNDLHTAIECGCVQLCVHEPEHLCVCVCKGQRKEIKKRTEQKGIPKNHWPNTKECAS